MVPWRRAAGEAGVSAFVAGLDGSAALFCRGEAACIALNRDESVAWEFDAALTMPPGRYCNIYVSEAPADCPAVDVGLGGAARPRVPPAAAVALHVGARAGA